MRCGNVLVLAVLLFLWLSSSCFLLLLCYCFITANTNSCLHRLSLGGLGHCLPVLGCALAACVACITRICMAFPLIQGFEALCQELRNSLERLLSECGSRESGLVTKVTKADDDSNGTYLRKKQKQGLEQTTTDHTTSQA